MFFNARPHRIVVIHWEHFNGIVHLIMAVGNDKGLVELHHY
jgi:hypothetical protein